MNILPRRPRARAGRAQALAAVGLLISGALGVGVLEAPAASADPNVHTIVQSTPESWAPYLSSTWSDLAINDPITISCYLTGDTVTGPYGSENVWDMVSGGYGASGYLVPDADVYTGSDSPVVPPCSATRGTAIGNYPVNVQYSSSPDSPVIDSVPLGVAVEITCYSTGTWMTGPYGSENIWDRLSADIDGSAGEWVPDALIYTGSDSAVVPHCP